MRRDPRRRAELGLSLIEALVTVAITAMLALLLLPLVSRVSGRNFSVAERALDAADAANAEAEFRELVRASLPMRGGQWRADQATLWPSLPRNVACARAGGPRTVRLAVAGDGRLLCESEGRRRVLLRWRDGAARFAFSADGRTWRPDWSGQAPPAFVRFELAGQSSASWSEHTAQTEETSSWEGP